MRGRRVNWLALVAICGVAACESTTQLDLAVSLDFVSSPRDLAGNSPDLGLASDLASPPDLTAPSPDLAQRQLDPSSSHVVVDRSTGVIADGVDYATITVTVVDSNDVP